MSAHNDKSPVTIPSEGNLISFQLQNQRGPRVKGSSASTGRLTKSYPSESKRNEKTKKLYGMQMPIKSSKTARMCSFKNVPRPARATDKPK